MTPQYFKRDDFELQFDQSFFQVLTDLSADKDDFFNGAYSAGPLGDIIFEDSRSPLAQEIPQSVFRSAFSAIFENFNFAGTFEYYMTVFRAVWGPSVTVTFTVPAPGKLEIDVEALSIELDQALARRIVSNVYVFDDLLTSNMENLLFQTAAGLKTQREAEALNRELVVGGVFVTITLEIV